MLYSFQKPFAELVANGVKQQTIRPIGKRRHAAPGDIMQFWTGAYRPGRRRKIGEAVCASAQEIIIRPADAELRASFGISLNGSFLTWGEREVLAIQDGFNNQKDFEVFFRAPKGGKAGSLYVFKGWLIKWDKLI